MDSHVQTCRNCKHWRPFVDIKDKGTCPGLGIMSSDSADWCHHWRPIRRRMVAAWVVIGIIFTLGSVLAWLLG